MLVLASSNHMSSTSAHDTRHMKLVQKRAQLQSEPVAEFQTGVPCTCCVFVGGSALPPSRPPSAPSSPRPASPSMQAGSMKNPDGSSTTGPAGAGLAVVGGYADGSLRLFGARAGQVAQRWAAQRHGAPVVAVTVHPRGGLVLSAARWGGSGCGLCVWGG